MRHRSTLALLTLMTLSACGGCDDTDNRGGGGTVPSGRCEVDLDETGLFSEVGTGAQAKVIESSGELFGGQSAEGRIGDVLLQNDRLRVVISQPGRHFSAVPYGGWIVDADLRRAEGEPGRDQFGRMGLLYAFGRTIDAQKVEILNDGSGGGSAVVAVTGRDALNDYLDVQRIAGDFLPNDVRLAVSADEPRPLLATTYYVLSPGEARVRVYTHFCNEGAEIVSLPLGDAIDPGGSTEFFNPDGCAGAMGAEGCLIDPTHGAGFQGDQVAYGYRSYRFDDMRQVSDDAILAASGVVGILAGAQNSNGVLTWMDQNAPSRPGTFGIRPGQSRGWLRDFFVTRDLAGLTSTWVALDGAASGRLKATVQTQEGGAAPGARVAVYSGSRMVTLLVADAEGKAHADLPPGTYNLYTGAAGHAIEAPVQATVGTNGTLEQVLKLGPSRVLTVKVQDPFGAPMPAKVTVLCPSGTCTTPASALSRVAQLELFPTNVAAVGLVPPQGTLALPLPPGHYEIVVTRGPEYSAWPETWPSAGEQVDLSAADQAVTATLAQVVDTSGWLSADLHVHAVNSPDSSVANEQRALTFMAEGVDLLVSTDHDFVTDFAPAIERLGGQAFLASMIGSEVSTFTYGHFNTFPMSVADAPRGGPFDWAGGGAGASLRASQIFAGVKQAHPDAVVQINHGRGTLGVLTQLKVDTDTLASHADPGLLRMEPAPDATAGDARLFDGNFDAIEVANGLTASTALLNDWMTQLSSGRRVAATGVSDSHEAFSTLGGYSRTYVDMAGQDRIGQFDAKRFAQQLKGLRAIGTNGPFVRVSAQRVDSGGAPVGAPVGIGDTATVSPSANEALELTIDVQAPEWIKFDTIEVYTHADGREALAGAANNTWIAPPAEAVVRLTPAAIPVEVAVTHEGQEFRRTHAVEKVTVRPVADTWYVVILRSSSAVGILYPLAYDKVTCSGALCTASAGRAYAFTNPIFVDADGSGAYDSFPQKVSRSVRLPPPDLARPVRVPTEEELNEALRDMLGHGHE